MKHTNPWVSPEERRLVKLWQGDSHSDLPVVVPGGGAPVPEADLQWIDLSEMFGDEDE